MFYLLKEHSRQIGDYTRIFSRQVKSFSRIGDRIGRNFEPCLHMWGETGAIPGISCMCTFNTNGHPSNWHWTFRNNFTTQYPILIRQAYRCKKNENRQNWSLSSTRNSVSKLRRADLQYLGLKTPLKTVNFQLFCWVLLCHTLKNSTFQERVSLV